MDGQTMGPAHGGVNHPPQALLADAQGLLTVASLLGRAGRTIESVIAGRSMGSTLPAGTRVRVRCGTPTVPALGSVVVVAVDGAVFAHRVVGRGRGRRTRGFLLTRGDATLLCDEPVPLDRVLGVVSEADRGRGWGPVEPAPGRPGPARAGAALHRWVMLTALAIHHRVAHGFARLSFRAARALLS